MTDEEFQLWRDEISVSEFKALVTERDDAQEAAETYHAAWQDAAVYWKEKVERLEREGKAMQSKICQLNMRLVTAQTNLDLGEQYRDRLHEALKRYGAHSERCQFADSSPWSCICGLASVLKNR